LGANFESFLLDDFEDWVWDNKKEDSDFLAYRKFVAEKLPNSVRANCAYAFSAYIRNKNEVARKYFQKCLELNPARSNAILYSNLMKFHENPGYEIHD
jgi:hypothetical protein